MKKLPIGIQTFEKIIKGDYVYVDKTKEMYDLINSYSYVFLSRPRRFGKSLFVDTLQSLFEGKKELFKGLYIYDKWEFEKYPIIKIDWAGDFTKFESTQKATLFILEKNQKRLKIECKTDDNPSTCFARLIQEAYEKYQKPVVVLIDEYDKPILDNLNNPQRAMENRDFLRGIYIQLKANDAYIKFVFLTGISKFSKASIFSGLNNLTDISLMPKYGNICGYTHEDLKESFKEYSRNFDLEKVKEWYNGYYFLKDRIYNPFDVLRVFDSGQFKNYWWESGNSYSLITLLKRNNYYIPNLENLKVSEELINTFEVDSLKLEVLLYQSGYLTIDKVIEEEFETEYKLKVPNREVQMSLNKLFIEYLTDNINNQQRKSLYLALKETNLEEFKNALISLFSSIPYNNYVKNNISSYEGYYASVIYSYLASLGLPIIAEDVTNRGRIDLTIKFKEKIYIIEFKVGDDDALKQIKEKKYHQKYLNKDNEVYLIGINFDEDEKNISRFEWKKFNN